MDTTANYAKAAATYCELALPQLQCVQQLWQWAGINVTNASAMLDVGAGPATLANSILAVHSQLQYYALDNSTAMLSHGITHPNLKPLVADMHAIPLASNLVDVCISSFALHWASNLPVVLAECIRVTKPGGHVLFAIPVKGSLQQLPERYPGFKVYDFPAAESVMLQLAQHCAAIKHKYMQFDIPANTLTGIMGHLRAVGGVISEHKPVAINHWRKWLHSDAVIHPRLPVTYQVLFVHGIKR